MSWVPRPVILQEPETRRIGDPGIRIPGISLTLCDYGRTGDTCLGRLCGERSAGLYYGDTGGAGMEVLRSVRARWPRPRGAPGPDATGPALSWIGEERIA